MAEISDYPETDEIEEITPDEGMSEEEIDAAIKEVKAKNKKPDLMIPGVTHPKGTT